MLRKDAEKMIGKVVCCWTGLRGSYVGELIELYGSPWRGKVKILSVIEYPVQGLSQNRMGFFARKPFNYGEIKDFGNGNIQLYEGVVLPYEKSLLSSLKQKIQSLQEYIKRSRTSPLNTPCGIEVKALDILDQRLKEIENV